MKYINNPISYLSCCVSFVALASCSNGNTSQIEEYLVNKYSNKGLEILDSKKPMGKYYYNTEIIDVEEVDVLDRHKDNYSNMYCANVKSDIQIIMYARDEQNPLRNLTSSMIVTVLKDGRKFVAQERSESAWKGQGCSIEFNKKVGNYF